MIEKVCACLLAFAFVWKREREREMDARDSERERERERENACFGAWLQGWNGASASTLTLTDKKSTAFCDGWLLPLRNTIGNWMLKFFKVATTLRFLKFFIENQNVQQEKTFVVVPGFEPMTVQFVSSKLKHNLLGCASLGSFIFPLSGSNWPGGGGRVVRKRYSRAEIGAIGPKGGAGGDT